MAHEVEKSCRNGVLKQNFCFGSGEGAIWPQSGALHCGSSKPSQSSDWASEDTSNLTSDDRHRGLRCENPRYMFHLLSFNLWHHLCGLDSPEMGKRGHIWTKASGSKPRLDRQIHTGSHVQEATLNSLNHREISKRVTVRGSALDRLFFLFSVVCFSTASPSLWFRSLPGIARLISPLLGSKACY